MAEFKPMMLAVFYWRCLGCAWEGQYWPCDGKCPKCGEKRVVSVRL